MPAERILQVHRISEATGGMQARHCRRTSGSLILHGTGIVDLLSVYISNRLHKECVDARDVHY